jgi:hypothetical protein
MQPSTMARSASTAFGTPVVIVTRGHGVHGVRQRQHVGDPPQHRLHLLARQQQPAQQQLGQDDRWHELDGLELAGGKGADEQPQRGAQHRVGDREHEDEPGRTGDVQPEHGERHPGRDGDLEHRERAEGQRVAEQQVQLRQRHGQQPLQRAGGALAQRGDPGHQEHRGQREDVEQRRPDPVEDRGLAVVAADEPGGGQQRGRNAQPSTGARRRRDATQPSHTRPWCSRTPVYDMERGSVTRDVVDDFAHVVDSNHPGGVLGLRL